MQRIRDLIADDEDPLKQIKDEHGRQVYQYKYFETSDTEWESAVRSVRQAIEAEKNWENATQLIKKLIDDEKDPLEKTDKNGREVYKHQKFLFFETDWERAVESVKKQLSQEAEEELPPLRRTLPSAAAPGDGESMAMTNEEFKDWKERNGYGLTGRGRHSRRHPRRHPRRHRGSRSGSSRMRSKGKRTYKKRNMRH